MGIKAKGKPGAPPDDAALSAVEIKGRVMMIGTAEEVIARVDASLAAAPEVPDDFDLDDAGVVEGDVANNPIFVEKLERRIRSVTRGPDLLKDNLVELHPPREGKHCLVLDIDYTIFDLGTPGEHAGEKIRPHLHEFLESAYEHYDIVIWSATGMKWVEGKMRQLGVLDHERYKVACLMDCLSMVTVTMDQYGTFNCKPLQVLWAHYRGFYGEENTIMFDDLRRNFVFNPQQGLRIKAFRKSRTQGAGDDELLRLRDYLALIAPKASFADLDHRRWERYVRKRADRLPAPPAYAWRE